MYGSNRDLDARIITSKPDLEPYVQKAKISHWLPPRFCPQNRRLMFGVEWDDLYKHVGLSNLLKHNKQLKWTRELIAEKLGVAEMLPETQARYKMWIAFEFFEESWEAYAACKISLKLPECVSRYLKSFVEIPVM